MLLHWSGQPRCKNVAEAWVKKNKRRELGNVARGLKKQLGSSVNMVTRITAGWAGARGSIHYRIRYFSFQLLRTSSWRGAQLLRQIYQTKARVGLSLLKHGLKRNANSGRPQKRNINYKFPAYRCDKEKDIHKPSIAIQLLVYQLIFVNMQHVSPAIGPHQFWIIKILKRKLSVRESENRIWTRPPLFYNLRNFRCNLAAAATHCVCVFGCGGGGGGCGCVRVCVLLHYD